MIEISFPAGELAYTLIWLLLRVAVWLRQRRIDREREALLLLMYLNLAVLLRIAFYPYLPSGGEIRPLVFDPAAILPFRLNLVPLLHILRFSTRRALLLNLLGNVAMFIPSGVILPIVYKRLDRAWKVVLAGAGISLCIELLQLPFAARATDIDDLILNTLGAAVGYAIFAAGRAIMRKTKPPRT